MGTEDKGAPSERRREARARAITLVSLGLIEDDGHAGEFGAGRTLDLSLHGMRLELSHPIAIGSRIRLGLALGPVVLEVEGVVRSGVELDDGQHALGIEFEHKTTTDGGDSRAILEKYLADHG